MKWVVSKNLLILFILCFFIGCSKNEEEFFSVLDKDATGIDFSNNLTETKDQNILDYLYFYNGGGVSIGDINNDGLPDIYFTGNQVKNKLYLNKGNFVFEDITGKAGVEGNSSWNTGVTMADVNGDGYLDIYVSAVVGVSGFIGHNELFINNGDLTFTESAADYGLDLENFSSQAAFFDADNDGDLDVYILNHAVHTSASFGPATIRNTRVNESGDKLFLNEGGKFIDVSEQAGIYGGANGYGLGISTADFNNDGFTDIYIGNDFHEDDYYYLNNGDGTFTESLKTYFGHISRFSMGSDAGDINNDGFYDLLTLDMLPDDEKVLKSSGGDNTENVHKLITERLGYHPQYSRNMLHINQEGKYFTEVALMSGIAATDWSWGALFADLDQDGIQDVFISTGIPKRPNDLDYIQYTSNEQIQQKLDKTNIVDQKALDLMPSGAVSNRFYRGKPSGAFENMTHIWKKKDSVISTGLAYGDLDNDGDLDIVTNNLNEPSTIYKNNLEKGGHLKVRLLTPWENKFGLGSKAILYTEKGEQVRQLYTTKGFQSSSEPVIHFGFPENVRLDSLTIVWPDQTFQTIVSPEKNKTLNISPEKNRKQFKKSSNGNSETWFTKTESNFGIDYEHKENQFSDFDIQKLIPHKISDNAPAVNVGDLNGDRKDDVVFGASRFQNGKIYLQEENGFRAFTSDVIAKDSLAEDTDVLIADFDKDGFSDILFTSGGGESIGKDDLLHDRLYLGSKEDLTFKKDEKFPKVFGNASVLRSADYDNDGYIDVFIGVDAVNYNYGAIPQSYLLQNKKGVFQIVEQPVFKDLGMITDASWEDFDGDGDLDLIVVGEWMSPKFIRNDNGRFLDVSKEMLPGKLNGLWQSIQAFDIDGDGDMDYLLGNWGLNSKFKASAENPLLMYYADFDGNGLTETLLAKEQDGKYYLLPGLDELGSQLTILKKKFPSYAAFAGKTVSEVLGAELMKKAETREVHVLASGYLRNENGKFTFLKFEEQLQVAPIKAFLRYDFNGDGVDEVLIGGNYFGVTPYHGKFGSMGGAILKKGGKLLNANEIGLNFAQRAVKNFSILHVEEKPYLMVTFNNSKVELYKLN